MKPKATLTTLESLLKAQLISSEDAAKLVTVIDTFPVSVTAHIAQHIDNNNPDDALRKQFIPRPDELLIQAEERSDPIGDQQHSPVKGIVHRYPDRALLTPFYMCPVYCRFCFRKEKVSQHQQNLSPTELDLALNYIATNLQIWEVIITGGDPLFLKPNTLKSIIKRLSAIEHVAIIRIHTRVPIVDPERINDNLIAALSTKKTVYCVLHVNHPQELTPESIHACQQLLTAGIPLLSQTVLLKGINDTISVLSELMRQLVQQRIKPYYLHHADLVRGTAHFRTSIAEGLTLVKQLRGRYSGLCQPTYVIDIPGGFGKVPLQANYLQETEAGFLIEDYLGQLHEYNIQA